MKHLLFFMLVLFLTSCVSAHHTGQQRHKRYHHKKVEHTLLVKPERMATIREKLGKAIEEGKITEEEAMAKFKALRKQRLTR
jgi:hypothetical protein